jgi:hypothetical protein
VAATIGASNTRCPYSETSPRSPRGFGTHVPFSLNRRIVRCTLKPQI